MKFTKALLAAGLCLFVSAQSAHAFEDKKTDRIKIVQQFLDNILTPLQDHVLTRLSLDIDGRDTRVETPAISAEGTAKFDRTFWDDQGATIKMRVKATGKDIEVGKEKTKVGQSTFHIALKMQSETVPLMNKAASIGLKEICKNAPDKDDPEYEIYKTVCDSLEQLEKASGIDDVIEALEPVFRAIEKAGKDSDFSKEMESLGYDLDSFGEGRDAHLFLKLYLLEDTSSSILKGVKHGSLELVMEDNAAYLRITAVIHHDPKILADARKELTKFADMIAKMPADQRAELEKKLIEKGQKASQEVKKAVLTGEYGSVVFTLLDLWTTGLDDL